MIPTSMKRKESIFKSDIVFNNCQSLFEDVILKLFVYKHNSIVQESIEYGYKAGDQ